MNLLFLFKKQKCWTAFGKSGLYFHLAFVFFSSRLLKLVFVSHSSDTGFMKESSSHEVVVLPCLRLEVMFKPKVPSCIVFSHCRLTLRLESGSFSSWETEALGVEGDAFLQHRYRHSNSSYIAHVEGFFAQWTKESGPFLLQSSEVGNDQVIWHIQGTCACAVQLSPDTTRTFKMILGRRQQI